jgi:hypothetical protein
VSAELRSGSAYRERRCIPDLDRLSGIGNNERFSGCLMRDGSRLRKKPAFYRLCNLTGGNRRRRIMDHIRRSTSGEGVARLRRIADHNRLGTTADPEWLRTVVGLEVRFGSAWPERRCTIPDLDRLSGIGNNERLSGCLMRDGSRLRNTPAFYRLCNVTGGNRRRGIMHDIRHSTSGEGLARL